MVCGELVGGRGDCGGGWMLNSVEVYGGLER